MRQLPGRRIPLVAGLLCVLAAAAVLIAGRDASPPRTPPAPASLRIGVIANALDDDAPRMARRVREANVRWMREEFRWSLVEPEEGTIDFSRYDAMMGTLAARGIRVLPLLIDTPGWAGPDRYGLPSSLPAWQAFVRQVTRRYGPGGRFWRERPGLDENLAPTTWEIWNEPYLPQFSDGTPDPAAYAALVKATVIAGRGTDPSLEFLAAGETSYVTADGATRNWTRDLFAAVPDLGTYVDAFAIHPYTAAAPGDTSVPRNQQFGRFVDIEADLVRLGVGPKPLWMTEIGWSTCTDRPRCVDAGRQGSYLADVLAAVAERHRDRVKAVFTYRFDDLRGDPEDPQARYGVIRPDGRPKPAYEVLRDAARGSR